MVLTMSEDLITDKLKSTCKNLTELLRFGFKPDHPSYFEVAKALVHTSHALLERDISDAMRESAQYAIIMLNVQMKAHGIAEMWNVPS